MAEISKVQVGGVSYDIKDTVAREAISGLTSAMLYIGETTTEITDGSSVNPVEIDGEQVEARNGNVVIFEDKEYVFNGNKWNEFGSTGSLKSLAFKDEASGQFTPVGTNKPSHVTLHGGATGSLETVSMPKVSGTKTIHDTPVKKTEEVGSASDWDAGTVFKAEVSGDELVLTQGTAPSLTISKKSVVTNIEDGDEVAVATTEEGTMSVATGKVSVSGQGDSVVTELPTSGTAAAQEFTGSEVSVTVR